jgi:hypothetical protein
MMMITDLGCGGVKLTVIMAGFTGWFKHDCDELPVLMKRRLL